MSKFHLLAASGIAALIGTPAWADAAKEVSEVVVTAAP